MAKVSINPTTLLMPVPVVMVTAADKDNKPNIITLAWVGTVCSDPPMVSISIRPSRFSNNLIKQSQEFVVNIPDESLLRQTDKCGVISGKDFDKFDEVGLTALDADKVSAPLIKECPINIECKVKRVIELGAHDMFIGEILAVHADKEVVSGSSVDISKAMPVAYCPHEYWSLKEKIGKYGFSAKG
ncbi:MAG: flavin reductase family protein [Actinobacteria bacterium]|nr:MAG: flavin reductase family protein [Actinomycetota bacterium]